MGVLQRVISPGASRRRPASSASPIPRRARTGVLRLLLAGAGALGLVVAVAAPASAEDPVSFTSSPIVDPTGVLDDETGEITAAMDELYDAHKVQLFVAYVGEFTNPADRTAWAEQTAAANGFGTDDVLLAIAVDSRQYQLSVGSDFALSDEQIDALQTDDIEPRLKDSDWSGAAVAAAAGIESRLGGGQSGFGAFLGGAAITGVLLLAVVVIAVVFFLLWRRSRRSRAEAAPPGGGVPLDELRRRAGSALVATDDAVKTSDQELGFAIAQFGAEAASEFTAALATAREQLSQAFTMQQRLDDSEPDTQAQQREWYENIVELCAAANAGLDAKAEAFDALRALEQNAPQALAAVRSSVETQQARIDPTAQALASLAASYPSSAFRSVADNGTQASERLAFAAESTTAAEADLARGETGAAAVAIRGAEEAAGQAEGLLDAIGSIGEALSAAEARLGPLAAAIGTDVTTAVSLLDSGTPGAEATAAVSTAVATTKAILAEVSAARTAGQHDPLALLARLQEADTTIDSAVEGYRDATLRSQRQLAALDSALLSARSQVSAAEDFITARRGAVGAEARTRLAEAGRTLSLATAAAASDPASALASAQRSAQLASEALQLAREDTDRFGSGGSGGIDELFGGGSRGGGLGGAILGGILIDSVLGGSRGGFGGGSLGGGGGGSRRGPGSFGGSGTRGRRGGGGHF